jgi:hypothetical protein
VDGNGDGKSSDNDLTVKQSKAFSSSYGSFISNNGGRDNSDSGLPVTDRSGTDGSIATMARVASQFVGKARGGWGEGMQGIVVISKTEAARSSKGPAFTWTGLKGARAGQSWIYLNSGYGNYFRHAGNMARAIIHEGMHPQAGSEADSPFGHQQLDGQARSRLSDYGLADSGCSSVGGTLGFSGSLFGGFPGC